MLECDVLSRHKGLSERHRIQLEACRHLKQSLPGVGLAAKLLPTPRHPLRDFLSLSIDLLCLCIYYK